MPTTRFIEAYTSLLRLSILLGCLLTLSLWAQADQFLTYVGTYTGKKSRGIYVSRFDSQDGSLSKSELAAETADPSFLSVHPNGRFLYAVNELQEFKGQPGGGVSSFRVDLPSGMLTPLNQQPTRGTAPCHLSTDRDGKTLLVANYSGGSVATYPIGSDGTLGPMATFIQHVGKGTQPTRQEGPHAHAIYVDPSGHYALAADLGLDQILTYEFDPERSSLAPHSPAFVSLKPGSGPRHLAFHPGGRYLYSVNELSSTITAFEYTSKTGTLVERQTVSTLPEGFRGESSTAEIFVHPSGKFLYGSNRGHDSIAVFEIDRGTGRLTSRQIESIGGKTPRGFAIDPTGRWLLAAGQNSDQVNVFKIDRNSGTLSSSGQTLSVPSPVCLQFLRLK